MDCLFADADIGEAFPVGKSTERIRLISDYVLLRNQTGDNTAVAVGRKIGNKAVKGHLAAVVARFGKTAKSRCNFFKACGRLF